MADNNNSNAFMRIFNGLFGAIFGMGFPGSVPGGGTQESSQTGPLFSNLRWYLASNFRQQLAQAYCEIGLIQTIVNVPVEDGMRGAHEVSSKQLTPQQLLQLRDLIEAEDDEGVVEEALAWNRLFGGAGIVLFTEQPPWEPLDEAKLKDRKFKPHAVDMWELFYSKQNVDGDNGPKLDDTFQYYDYYGYKLHRSRVIPFRGIKAPSFLRPRLRGWGLSVVDILVRSINQYMKGTNLIYELLDEAKIDVYGICDLTNTLLGQNGTDLVRQRIQLANQQKNFQHALVMDSKDTYQQKTLTFSGLADVMKEVRYQVASDLRMPLTKIFGISASGFNSGEDDIEVYNGMVESSVRKKARKALTAIYKLRCLQLFGFAPTDLRVTLAPMRLMTADEEQSVKTKKFERISTAFNQKAMTLVEYREACNRDNLLEIQLEPENAELEQAQEDKTEAENAALEAPQGPSEGSEEKAQKDTQMAQKEEKPEESGS